MKKKVSTIVGQHDGGLMLRIQTFDGGQAWAKIKSVSAGDGKFSVELDNGLGMSLDGDKELDVFQTPALTPKRNHETPRLLMADAYTVGSDEFASDSCRAKSVYYMTARKKLSRVDDFLYDEGDDRIILVGVQKTLDHLFRYPVTHEEIDETKRFLDHFEVTTKGLCPYSFPEAMWRHVVEAYNGYIPVEVRGLPEGSVLYPNECGLQVTSLAPGDEKMGELAAWFESKMLQVWSQSERATQDTHFKKKLAKMVQRTLGCEWEQAWATAGNMVHDFGDRAGMNWLESEQLGMTALYTFGGTDTCAGAYQAYKNGAVVPGVSVKALAHRNVQGYDLEEDAYRAIYDAGQNGSISSMVADCYEFYTAVEKKLLKLALESKASGNGKIVVARPDSGNAKEQCLWVCKLAKFHGLYEEVVINGKTWYKGTYLKFLEGDGMTYPAMIEICELLLENGFLPWEWGVPFGVGGGQRNGLKRDNFSWKYALASRGLDDAPVVKFSETLGKTTLPGPFKLLRSAEALAAKKTMVHVSEPGEDAMQVYYTGNGLAPFGPAMEPNFEDIKSRIGAQLSEMPATLWTESNHGYPASDLVIDTRVELLKKYAPKKRVENYK
jgi:nicotinamide phosphoribosyltransferase